MTSAVYGRMKIGRCVKKDIGFLGCHNDALDVMDAECSGRRECQILVSNQNFRKNDPGACMNALNGYIAASFRCVKGRNFGKRRLCA